MAGSSEARQLHSALISVFAAFFERLEDSRLERRSGYVFLVCPSVPFQQFNGVWAEEDGGAAVADLAGNVAAVEQLGLPFWLQTRQGRHPMLEEEATRLGLREVEPIPGMVAPAASLNDLPETGMTIERVTAGSRLHELQAVAEAGFEVPPGAMAALYTEGLIATSGTSWYLGNADGDLVSTGIGVQVDDTVGIFSVATPPAQRRRGYGAAITAHAAADGFERGARLAWLQSSPQGEPVYRRMGFRQVETYNLFTRA